MDDGPGPQKTILLEPSLPPPLPDIMKMTGFRQASRTRTRYNLYPVRPFGGEQ